jgi:hypothetical protein
VAGDKGTQAPNTAASTTISHAGRFKRATARIDESLNIAPFRYE